MNNLIDAFITRSHLPSSVTAVVQVATLPFLISEDDVGSDGHEDDSFFRVPLFHHCSIAAAEPGPGSRRQTWTGGVGWWAHGVALDAGYWLDGTLLALI